MPFVGFSALPLSPDFFCRVERLNGPFSGEKRTRTTSATPTPERRLFLDPAFTKTLLPGDRKAFKLLSPMRQTPMTSQPSKLWGERLKSVVETNACQQYHL